MKNIFNLSMENHYIKNWTKEEYIKMFSIFDKSYVSNSTKNCFKNDFRTYNSINEFNPCVGVKCSECIFRLTNAQKMFNSEYKYDSTHLEIDKFNKDTFDHIFKNKDTIINILNNKNECRNYYITPQFSCFYVKCDKCIFSCNNSIFLNKYLNEALKTHSSVIKEDTSIPCKQPQVLKSNNQYKSNSINLKFYED